MGTLPHGRYKTRIEDDEQNVSKTDSMEDEDEEAEEDGDEDKEEPAELWDLLRPLIGDCKLRLLKFDDKEAQVWGSCTCLDFGARSRGCPVLSIVMIWIFEWMHTQT